MSERKKPGRRRQKRELITRRSSRTVSVADGIRAAQEELYRDTLAARRAAHLEQRHQIGQNVARLDSVAAQLAYQTQMSQQQPRDEDSAMFDDDIWEEANPLDEEDQLGDAGSSVWR